MKRWLFYGFTALAVLFNMSVVAQSPCATLDVSFSSSNGSVFIPCDTNKVIDLNFNATINLNFAVNETDTYAVNPIPYNPQPWVGANTFTVTSDDIWSPAYPIPFSFCFFGQTYNQFVIGSNGQISFNTARANAGNNWATSGIFAPDNNADMNNTIMGCYHDILFSSTNGATCTWDTVGVAPCRKLIINWIAPMFNCTSLIDSQQVVLHEFTNLIEVNIANKPLCTTWNDTVAHQGVQNDAGTKAFMTPGRNGTVWSANNDSYRFEPAGQAYPFATTYTWRNVTTGNIIDTGANITLKAPFPPGVVCEAAIYGGCNTDTSFARDTTIFIPGMVTADIDIIDDSVCQGDPIVFTNLSTVNGSFAPAPQLLQTTWDYGDGNIVVNNAATHSYYYGQGGTYTVKMKIIDTILGCEDSLTRVVFVEGTPFAAMSATPTTICQGEKVYFTDSTASHALTTKYDFGDGNVRTDIHNPVYVYEKSGQYTASYSGQYLICPDPEETVIIQVNEYPLLDLGPDTAYCPGLTEPITLENLKNPSEILQWSNGTTGASLSVQKPGRYWASVTNNNCSSRDSIWVQRDCYLNIPNSFSPNGDGSNDYFMPRQLLSSGLKEFEMKIYNRWGEIVFKTNKLDGRGWDGKLGGKDLPMGVYVYVVDAQWENNFRNSFRGNLTLLR